MTDGAHEVRFRVLAAQHPETPYRDGLDHDIDAEFLVALNRCRTERVAVRIRALLLAGPVGSPGVATSEQNFQVARIRDVHDLEIAPDILAR